VLSTGSALRATFPQRLIWTDTTCQEPAKPFVGLQWRQRGKHAGEGLPRLFSPHIVILLYPGLQMPSQMFGDTSGRFVHRSIISKSTRRRMRLGKTAANAKKRRLPWNDQSRLSVVNVVRILIRRGSKGPFESS
jgi:hypothetical protein